MLRVVLVVSNFLEAPNGGGAGGNQQQASPSSLRERCNGTPSTSARPPNDSHVVAFRTREHRAEPIVLGPNRNVVVRSEGIGSPKYTKPLQTGA
jgi:hypothetical protein